jgi:hypothetical protein
MSILYIGLDDTDILDSPGTGRLARDIAAGLAERWPVMGITRHQSHAAMRSAWAWPRPVSGRARSAAPSAASA